MNDEPGELHSVLAEFTALKRGSGLDPRKMSSARHIRAVMREPNAAAATQRLLDDLADLAGPDGLALAHALNIKTVGAHGETLTSRRDNSGLDLTTARQRERRAAIALYKHWSVLAGRRLRYAPKAVSKLFSSSFPVEAVQQMGDRLIRLIVLVDDRLGPIISIQTRGRSVPSADTLTLMNQPDRCVITYTSDIPWHLELFTPPMTGEVLRVHRPDIAGVKFIRLELPDSSGVAQDDIIHGPELERCTSFGVPLGLLVNPGAITWHRDEEPHKLRPALTFPND